jgi:AcrR family transcriptional regulator
MSEADRRRSLLAAATELAREHGLARLTGRDVAARAGVSIGLVHYYFSSIEELIVEVFTRVQEEDLDAARAEVADADGPLQALDALIAWFAPVQDGWRYQLWIDAWSLARHHPLLRAESRRLNLRWRDLFLDVVQRGRAAGDFDVSDPRAAAWRVMSLLDAMHIAVANEQIDAAPATVHRWVRRGIALELGISQTR